MKKLLAALFLLTAISVASAQAPVKQSGTITPGHPVMWTTNGVVQDAGTAVAGFLTGVGVIAQGPGICQNTGPVTAPHNQICISANAASPYQLIIQSLGGSPQQPLQFVVNGVTYNFPFTGPGTGVIGPGSTTIGDLVCWNSNIGGAVSDCGIQAQYTNPAALAAANISASLNAVSVINASGSIPPAFGAGGISTCALTYTRGTSTPSGLTGEVLNTVSGIYWEPRYSTSPVRTCEFGAIGDGTISFTTGVITGTDNTAAIQAALDFAMRSGFNTVCINDGSYKTSDVLMIGWGEAFRSLSFISCSYGNYAGQNLFKGVTIFSTKTDRCTIDVQGGRGTRISGMTIVGQNAYWINNSSFIVTGAPYPATDSSWLNPAIVPTGSNPGGIQRDAPYAGICFGAYSGAQPTIHYPALTYPSWTGLSAQYNLALNSDMTVEDVMIDGFGVGIMNMPNRNSDGNGDFLKVNRVQCNDTVYCWASVHTQGRNNQIANLNSANVYTMITNIVFGKMQGEMNGPISNIACGQCYQIANIATPPTTGTLILEDVYAEATVRFGNFANSSQMGFDVVVHGCNVSNSDAITQTIPVAWFESIGYTSFSLINCGFNGPGAGGVLAHGALGLFLDGGAYQGGYNSATVYGGSAGLTAATNFSGGLFLGVSPWIPGNFLKFGNPLHVNGFMPDNVTLNDFFINEQACASLGSTVRLAACQGTTQLNTVLNGGNGQVFRFVTPPPVNQFVTFSGGGALNNPLISGCDTLTFNSTTGNQSPVNVNTMFPGTILYGARGGLFYVTAVGSPSGGQVPITARQINAKTVNVSGICVSNQNPDPTFTDNYELFQTNVKLPNIVFYCNFTAGSVNGTSCDRGDGFAGNMNSYLNVGDILYGDQTFTLNFANLSYPFAFGTTLATVTNGSPGSLTLSAQAKLTGRFPVLPMATGIVSLPAVVATHPTNIVPSANSCTGFALGANANDLAGTLTYTSATTCSVNFGTSFAAAPACSISPSSAASTVQVTTSTTGFAATFGTAQTALQWNCAGL
jgi:hypothetical protein